ncbi:DUF305 domain-containing protein [Aquipuribacter sp. MA13-6]|uniref:DUF305 domain-containing protein n=1 Tax=unclassified Aquipuribacter TaxID=2635084 RepID=UPI003EEC5266
MPHWTAPMLGLVAAVCLTGCAAETGSDVARPEPTTTFTAGEVPVIVPGAPGESPEVIDPGGTGSMANPGAYDEDEVTFVTNMVPHHTQALAMAELAADRAQDERVRGLAERITLGQGPEIATMQAWLTAQGLPEADPQAGHDSHEDMRGMATPEQMFELESADGAEFDRLFLELMTTHHEGAIDMAGEATGAQHPIVADMVDGTVASQGAEIAIMQELLADL